LQIEIRVALGEGQQPGSQAPIRTVPVRWARDPPTASWLATMVDSIASALSATRWPASVSKYPVLRRSNSFAERCRSSRSTRRITVA